MTEKIKTDENHMEDLALLEELKEKIGLVKVENMRSPQGNSITNQFILRGNDFEVFQSYDTVIAIKYKGKTYLDETCWDCSTTTGKYRNLFLWEKKAETMKKIKSGKYILANLN